MANIINRQQTFSTNGTVTAAGLHNLIDTALVNSAIIKNQQEITSIGTADLLLIAPDSVDASLAPRKVTVQNLIDDGLTAGTFTSLNLTGDLTYGTATGNRTVSTSATITNGTITSGVIPTGTFGTTTSTAATITNGTITTGLIPTLTAGTTTGTAGIFTSGTVSTLKSTTGTITNLSTTLAGDFTISQGTATLGTTGATLGTYGGSTSVPVLAINAKGQITSTGTAAITSGLTGFRNRIINGDMRIDQRNAGSVVTISTGSPSYILDRWVAYQNSPSTLVQISRNTSAPSGFQNSIKWGRNGSGTAGGVTVLAQALETANSIDAQGGTVTLSFYAKAGANFSSASSLLGVLVYSGTGTDESVASMVTNTWTGKANPINSSATLTTSWQKFTFTSSTLGASVSQLGVYLNWTTVGAAGADDNVYITGVQLEVGSTATEFERRPIGLELSLCQRYYYELPSGATNAFVINAGQQTSTNAYGSVFHPVDMRIAPTLGVAGTTAAYYTIVNSTTVACTSLPVISGMSSPRGSAISMGASASVGYASWIAAATSAGKLSFSSEL